MSHSVIELSCPGCGARVSTGQKVCDWCHKPIVISTFNSVYSMPLPELNKYTNTYKAALVKDPDSKELNKAIALCYLKLRMFDKAIPSFEKAIEDNFDDSELYFYAAICLLRGKKAFLAARKDIDRIEEYIQAALMVEPKGIYYYFWAYIKQDYFDRKSYRTSPTYLELLDEASQVGLSDFDIDQLFGILNVQRPSCL